MTRTTNPSLRALGLTAFGSVLCVATILAIPVVSGGSVTGAVGDTALVSVEPARLLDTRESTLTATVDGLFVGGGPVAAGSTTRVKVAARGGVDATAAAVMLNVAAVNPAANGFLTVFDCSSDVPLASSVNFQAGNNTSNGVLAVIDGDGDVCLHASASTELLIDVNAFVPATGSPIPLTPTRLVDTRAGAAVDATADGLDVGDGAVPAMTVREIVVAGRGGIPLDAQSAVLNVAAVLPEEDGYATVYPCGTDTPLASTLNYVAGITVPNLSIVGLGTDGTVCVYADGTTDLVVDVNGYVPAGATPESLVPARLTDTRSTGATVDGLHAGTGAIEADSIRVVPVNGRGGVPTGAETVVLNVTAVQAETAGHFRVYPCGTAIPDASSVNYPAHAVVANLVVVGVGSSGSVCVYSSAVSDLVVDVSGSVDVEPDPEPSSSCDDVAASFSTKGSVNPDLADPESSAVCVDGAVVISANGIPDYTYIRTSPGDPNAQDLTYEIPGTPTPAATTSDVARVGSIAVATNGVPIYGPTEGTGGDVLSLGGALSECGSHNGPGGFHMHLMGTSSSTDCIYTPAEVAAGPKLLGYAFDGYPIYTGNDQYTSSWELTDASLFATDTWSAHSYVAGSGDLDECNGRTDEAGNYAYYTTDTFPYMLGCYTGTPTENGGGGDDGAGGGGPPR